MAERQGATVKEVTAGTGSNFTLVFPGLRIWQRDSWSTVKEVTAGTGSIFTLVFTGLRIWQKDREPQ